MKSSTGYTAILNIAIIFIVVMFAFIAVALNYYKGYKNNNGITNSVVKYEGFNEYAQNEIQKQLSSLGYNQSQINCGTHEVKVSDTETRKVASLVGSGNGYCVYYNIVKCLDSEYMESSSNTQEIDTLSGKEVYCRPLEYNFIIKTFIIFEVPIVHNLLRFPVYTKSDTIYACYGSNC